MLATVEINKKIICSSFQKRWETYDRYALAQKSIAKDLMQKTVSLFPERSFGKVFELGCGSGLLTRELIQAYKAEQFFLNDLCSDLEFRLSQIMNDKAWSFHPGDIEVIDFPSEVDMIISSSTFQWVNNLDALFQKISSSLNPGGILAFSTFGSQNIYQFSQLSGNVLNYFNPEDIKSKLDPFFDDIYFVEKKEDVYFNSVEDVFTHLKLSGVNAFKSSGFNRSKYLKIKNGLSEILEEEKKITLSYHPLYFWGRKKEY
ncbi:MAG: malonyl-ACP O-methyltransferase BioC [Bacteroidales bacterium]